MFILYVSAVKRNTKATMNANPTSKLDFATLVRQNLDGQNTRAIARQFDIPYEFLVKIKNGNVALSHKSKYVDNFAAWLDISKPELEKNYRPNICNASRLLSTVARPRIY
jgi:hypothetical protein